MLSIFSRNSRSFMGLCILFSVFIHRINPPFSSPSSALTPKVSAVQRQSISGRLAPASSLTSCAENQMVT